MKLLNSSEGEASGEEPNNLLDMLRRSHNMEKKGKSNYIEVTFGNAFDFKGLTEDLIPTIKALEEKLMPVMEKGHAQQKELHILTLQSQGAQIVKQTEEAMEVY